MSKEQILATDEAATGKFEGAAALGGEATRSSELTEERRELVLATERLKEMKARFVALQQAHAVSLQAEAESRAELDAMRSESRTLPMSAAHEHTQLQHERLRAERAERALADAYEVELLHGAGRTPMTQASSSARVVVVVKDTEQVDHLKRTIDRQERAMKQHRQALADLEGSADRVRNTLSFRLGYALIHASKSWESLRNLPRELWVLHQDAKGRGEARRTGVRRRPSDSSSASKTPVAVEILREEERFADETMKVFAQHGHEAAARFAEERAANDRSRAMAFTRLAKAAKLVDVMLAKSLAARAYALDPVPFRTKWLAFVQYDSGEIERPAALLSALTDTVSLKASERARVAQILGLARLQQRKPVVPELSARAYAPIPDSAMYVAASSLPFTISGYTVRTHELLKALGSTRWQVGAVLRPGYPDDQAVLGRAGEPRHVLDGVRYERLPGPHARRIGLDEYVEKAALALMTAAKRMKPAIIHAASNHVNALPALVAARRLGIPFIYEVRGMWELTAATRNVDWESSERFLLERDLETLVAKHADHVLTLTEGLANELASRGVARNRIDILPNSVDPLRFAPRRKSPELLLRFGFNASAFTLVYAGSLLHYEGLDDLVRAIAMLVNDGADMNLAIAGDGEAQESLQALAVELGIERRVKLLGRLAPQDIPELWSLADAAAFPRKPYQVCQLVSPLKPLEPMAMAIPIVVSDVAALREMVRDGENGLVHVAGDAASLAAKLRLLVDDAELRSRLGEAAREFVLNERTWQVASERVADLYGQLQLLHSVSPVPLPAGRSSMTESERQLLDTRLEEAYGIGGVRAVRNLVARQAAGRSVRMKAFCLLKAAACCQRMGDPEAVELTRASLACDASASSLRGVARVLYWCGDFAAAADVVDRLERELGSLVGKDERLAREVRGRVRLLAMLQEPRGVLAKPVVAERSVYFLHFSLPHTSVGYATRSHGLIVGMKAAGFDVRPYTRCGFPFDFKPELAGTAIKELEHVDGVDYRRLLEGGRRGNTESDYLIACVDAYERVLREERPQVVHAASNYATALPALLAARRVGLPFIYEIRGFWEITRSSRDSEFESTGRFSLMRHFETLVARNADHVYTLTSAMKEELVRRGVQPEQITLVHNGVDPERFVPLDRNDELARQLGLSSEVPIIGYVGSLVDYEGLDDLLHACGMLARRGVSFRLLIVGDGAELAKLRTLTKQEGIDEHVTFTGRVPHTEVEAYYSLVDVCPFPRKPWEVCEMVSPLKPFEAMAMGKAVIASDTHALREIIADGDTGLLFTKGNSAALAVALERLLVDDELRRRVAQNGREWTLRHRTWREGGRIAVEGYRDLLSRHTRSTIAEDSA